MQIVIDIPEMAYSYIKREWVENDFDSPINHAMNGIKNGMPLPKWHGDLIDRSQTLRTDRFDDGHEGLRTIQEYAVYAKIRRYLQSLPAIIPAEKEVRE